MLVFIYKVNFKNMPCFEPFYLVGFVSSYNERNNFYGEGQYFNRIY